MSETYIQEFTVNIPPATSHYKIGISGNFVKCISTTAKFKMSVNESSRFSAMDSGRKLNMSGAESFTSLIFQNLSSEPIKALFLVGVGNVEDDKLSLKEFPSYLVTGSQVIDANAEFKIESSPKGTFDVQKAVIISNSAPTENIHVMNEYSENGGSVGHMIRANESHEMRTAQSVVIANLNAVAVQIYYTQIIYGE